MKLKRGTLRALLICGFVRFFADGSTKWSKKDLYGLLHPRDESHELESKRVQTILKELENEGYIKLFYKDEFYLEVLKHITDERSSFD